MAARFLGNRCRLKKLEFVTPRRLNDEQGFDHANKNYVYGVTLGLDVVYLISKIGSFPQILDFRLPEDHTERSTVYQTTALKRAA